MVLPNFLICGAAKAGTNALFRYLGSHPNVCVSRPKETHFFHREYDKGKEWFASHFEHCDNECAVGEGSVKTMACPKAPQRIRETVPDARLLFILRNPIERAYSHYYYNIYQGVIDPDRSFGEVIQDPDSEYRRELIWLGCYEQHLRNFEQVFPQEQMLVLLNRDLRQNLEGTMRRTCAFLEIDASKREWKTKKQNVTKYPKNRRAYHYLRASWHVIKDSVEAVAPQWVEGTRQIVRRMFFDEERPSMSPSVRRHLREVYSTTIEQIEERVHSKLDHWR